MERQSRKKGLRSDFRELATRLDKFTWNGRTHPYGTLLMFEKRLIEEETELLAKIDDIVKEFRDRIASRT